MHRRQYSLRLSVLVLYLALASCPATAGPPALHSTALLHTPGTRRLLTDQRASPAALFVHTPFVSCASEVATQPLATMQPTQSAAECAARCDASYNARIAEIKPLHGFNLESNSSLCSAFKYARTDPSPPLAGYSRCVLLFNVTQASCGMGLVRDAGALQYPGQLEWIAATGIVWDYYWRVILPAPNPSAPTFRAEMNITGTQLSGVQLLPLYHTAHDSPELYLSSGNLLIAAIQTAIGRRCCAANVGITNVTDVSNTTVNVQLTMTAAWVTDANPFAAAYLDLVLSDALGAAALLATIQTAFPNVTAVSYTALTTTTGLLSNATTVTAVCSPHLERRHLPPVGFVAALIVVCAALLAVSVLYIWRRDRGAGISTDVLKGVRVNGDAAYDVFVSYRRGDLALADAVVDQLSLAGLRVFYDRAGAMAGRPFEEELCRAVRQSRITSVLVTIDFMRLLVQHRPDRIDWLLAEMLIAVHYMRVLPGHRIFPLLIGVPCGTGQGARHHILADAEFAACRDALPDVVPAATLALVTRMLAQDGGELDAALQGITVRQLILGQPQPGFSGLLSIASVSIHGPDDHMGLLLRHRYAEQMLRSLQHAVD
jgi:TIR domain